MSKFSINFEEILSLTRGNFKVHDKVVESSTYLLLITPLCDLILMHIIMIS